MLKKCKKMKKHKAQCPPGEEFCLKCGLSYENNIHKLKQKLRPVILFNKGRQCGILGNEERYYNAKMSKPSKKGTLVDVINK